MNSEQLTASLRQIISEQHKPQAIAPNHQLGDLHFLSALLEDEAQTASPSAMRAGVIWKQLAQIRKLA